MYGVVNYIPNFPLKWALQRDCGLSTSLVALPLPRWTIYFTTNCSRAPSSNMVHSLVNNIDLIGSSIDRVVDNVWRRPRNDVGRDPVLYIRAGLVLIPIRPCAVFARVDAIIRPSSVYQGARTPNHFSIGLLSVNRGIEANEGVHVTEVLEGEGNYFAQPRLGMYTVISMVTPHLLSTLSLQFWLRCIQGGSWIFLTFPLVRL